MKKKHFPKGKTIADLLTLTQWDRRKEYRLDPLIAEEMEFVEGQVSYELYHQIVEMMQGFTLTIQFEMADNLYSFIICKAIYITGFPSVDTILVACYEKIAQEKGYKIEELEYYIDYPERSSTKIKQ